MGKKLRSKGGEGKDREGLAMASIQRNVEYRQRSAAQSEQEQSMHCSAPYTEFITDNHGTHSYSTHRASRKMDYFPDSPCIDSTPRPLQVL
jgi:hypothetical protein